MKPTTKTPRTKYELVSALEGMIQRDQLVFDDYLVTREATCWLLYDKALLTQTTYKSSGDLADYLVDAAAKLERERKREAKMKAPTRMTRLFEGVSDDELAVAADDVRDCSPNLAERLQTMLQNEFDRRAKAREEMVKDVSARLFSDGPWSRIDREDLLVVDDGLVEVDLNSANDVHAVTRIREEIKREIQRRDDLEPTPTYQGPGRYVDVTNGTTTNVVGSALVKGIPYALVGYSAQDPNLWAYPMDTINERLPDGRRRFTFKH